MPPSGPRQNGRQSFKKRDNNSITIDGATSLAVSDSEVQRFRASGWHVQEIDECWESILDTPRQAALLALSRQPMPLLRRDPGNENSSAKGGYILLEAEGGERKLTILSSGSELHLAVEARVIHVDAAALQTP